MLLIREIMFCKPGKAKPLVEKFIAMDKLGKIFAIGMSMLMTAGAGRAGSRMSRAAASIWAEFRESMAGS